MTNIEKLKDLVVEVFLIDPSQFKLDLRREEVETWDSLGLVSLAVGVHDTFGYHFTVDEAVSVTSVKDVITILEQHGVLFHAA